MDNAGTINDQVTDAVSQTSTLVLGSAAPQSLALLDVTGAETMGMSMHNAVTSQQNAQISAMAAITSVCAKMLKVQAPAAPEPSKPDDRTPPPFLPISTSGDSASEMINQASTLAQAAASMLEKSAGDNQQNKQDLQKLIASLQKLAGEDGADSSGNSSGTGSGDSGAAAQDSGGSTPGTGTGAPDNGAKKE